MLEQDKEREEPTIVATQDGSDTLAHALLGEHYHSLFGAVAESEHIYIGAGLQHYITSCERDAESTIALLEVGFATSATGSAHG